MEDAELLEPLVAPGESAQRSDELVVRQSRIAWSKPITRKIGAGQHRGLCARDLRIDLPTDASV